MYEDDDQAMWQGSSVNLEPGDLFVIIRGEMVHPGGITILGAEVPPKFDDKFGGVVFEVLEVCDTMVAAKARFPHHHIDRTLSLNVAGLETMTVTQRYLDELLKGRNEAEEQQQPAGQTMSIADFLRHLTGDGQMGSGMGPKGFVIGSVPQPEDGPNFPGNLPGNLPGFSPDEDNKEPTEE